MFETFISYAWRDGADFAERLEAALPGSWRDKNAIDRVRGFDREIEEAIKACKWFVLCCSQDILRGDSFVRDEMIYARLHKKPIIVVRLQDITPPISVIRQPWIDYFRLGWDATLNEVRRVMAQPPEQPPEPAPKRPSARTRLAPITSNDPQKNRAQLIARVRHDWIEGILYPTLEDARHVLKIGVAPKSDAVLNHEGFNYRIDPEATIETIFNDISERRLLILGDPGAGKTVLLLQLAEALLEQAERSPAARVPVVFNLASWAQTRKPIFDWMNEELKRFYDVRARKALERWMKNDALIFLFDGLDEVKEEARAACLEALNEFQARHKPPMVVCSRVTDYESLPQKLNLKSAILLKPLSQAQVDQFLAAGSLTRLKRLVESDAVVQEMSRNPFLLNTMAYAYDDSNPDLEGMSRPRDPAERREHLFDAYIRRRFAESLRKPYDLDDTLRYLRFLAKNMQAYSQTIFRPELIDERWLGGAPPKQIPETLTIVLLSLLTSLTWLAFGLSLGMAWWAVLLGILASSLLLRGIALSISSWQRFERLFEQLQSNVKRLWIAFHLRQKRLIPFNLQAFIRFVIALNIMRAYGGGFAFTHRYLRETLAGLDGAAVLARRAAEDSEAFAQLIEITEQTPDILVSLLKHEDSAVRRVAVEALGKLREARAVEPLIARLSDDNSDVRCAAAEALGQLGNRQAVEPLIVRLNDDNSDVRRAAAETLGRLSEAQAIEPLIARLSDGNSDVRRAAAKSLDELTWQAQTQAQQIAYLIATQACDEIVRIGEPAVESLIASLKDDNWDVRRMAAEALVKISEPAVEPLVRRLVDEDWSMKRAVAEVLGQLGDARAVKPLIRCMGDDDWDVRRAAAKALEQIHSTGVVTLLIAQLIDDDWDVRRAAAEALGKLGNMEAVEPLIARLEDNDWDVRRAAAEALGELGDTRAVEPLIVRLSDDDWNVRRAAAEALGRLGDAQSVEPLVACLRDDDRDVRHAAAEALAKIGESSVELLIELLDDKDSNVTLGALRALGRIGDVRAVKPITRLLDDQRKPLFSQKTIGEVAQEALRAIEAAAHKAQHQVSAANCCVKALKLLRRQQALRHR
jgi:HEAT repeat protein